MGEIIDLKKVWKIEKELTKGGTILNLNEIGPSKSSGFILPLPPPRKRESSTTIEKVNIERLC